MQPYDRLYGPTYFVLDALQKVFYSSNAAREAFVEMCESNYVQRVRTMQVQVRTTLTYLPFR
jgi:geranylgeranyl reductase